MRTAIVTAMILGCVGIAGAASSGGEAPSATDLLRAETAAELARKRLERQPRPVARWVQGGSGWGAKAAAPRVPHDKASRNRAAVR